MRYYKTTLFLCFFSVSQNIFARNLESELLLLPVIGVIETEDFVSKETFNNYYLKIDAENSFFEINQNPYIFSELEISPSQYSVSGEISLFEHHFDNEFYILDETIITSLSIETTMSNIDLSSPDFWNEELTVN